MTDRKSSSGAATGVICDIQDLEPKQEKCVAGGSERKWEIPSLQDLEEVLHSAPSSLSRAGFKFTYLGITHVLNASHGKLCCKGSDDFYGTTVKYYGVPANDLPTFDLSPYFYPAAEFIHQALTSGGRVFVHCAVGVSRSAALVLAYLMIHHHLSLLSSIRCVQQKRWIFPNRGFLRQLIGHLGFLPCGAHTGG
uniref:Dual specificity protein phosphatase n=1 Tax=Oreochromis niloticus TaxID=8128 RepID=A0A669CEY1_ORENI